MSKRFKLGILTKEKHDLIKNLSYSQLRKEYGLEEGITISKLSNEIFSIGKNFDDSFLQEFQEFVFKSNKVNKILNNEVKSNLFI